MRGRLRICSNTIFCFNTLHRRLRGIPPNDPKASPKLFNSAFLTHFHRCKHDWSTFPYHQHPKYSRLALHLSLSVSAAEEKFQRAVPVSRSSQRVAPLLISPWPDSVVWASSPWSSSSTSSTPGPSSTSTSSVPSFGGCVSSAWKAPNHPQGDWCCSLVGVIFRSEICIHV